MVYWSDVNASLANPACDQPVAGWLVLGIILIIFRLLNSVVAVRGRQERRAQSSPRAATGSSSRRHIRSSQQAEFTEYAIAAMQTVYFVLTSVNVANTINSGSGVLHGFFLIPLAINHLSFIRNMIKLGKNIIPLSRKVQLNLSEHSFLTSLSNVDNVLRFFGFMSVSCLVAIVIVFIVGAAGYPGQFWSFEAAFLLTPSYQGSTTFMAVWQVQRCRAALQRLLKENMLSGSMKVSVEGAVNAMLLQQAVIVGITLPVLALCILFAIGVVPLYWWLLCVVFFGSDTIMVLFVNVLPKCRRKRSTTSASTSNEVVMINMSGQESRPEQSH